MELGSPRWSEMGDTEGGASVVVGARESRAQGEGKQEEEGRFALRRSDLWTRITGLKKSGLCFAKIPCALKIVRFPATMAAFQVIPSPSNAKNLSRGTRAVYLYI